jgi:protease-4
MARRHPILRGFLILIGAFVCLLIGLGVVVRVWKPQMSFRAAVAVVELEGVIEDTTELVETLGRYRTDKNTVGIVLRVDSPGGGVAPAQELYDAIWRLRGVKPVIASFGNVAASAAYYISTAADVIIADPGTLTGSIGAIMEFQNYEALANKVGVGETVVKSGHFKDVGHPLRPLADDERAMLQGVVDDALAQFIDAVAKGRGLDPDRVRTLADGRVYSGAQAQAVGLVDRLGGLDDAQRLAWERAGQQGEPRIVRVRAKHRPWWLSFFERLDLPETIRLGGGLLFLYEGSLPH